MSLKPMTHLEYNKFQQVICMEGLIISCKRVQSVANIIYFTDAYFFKHLFEACENTNLSRQKLVSIFQHANPKQKTSLIRLIHLINQPDSNTRIPIPAVHAIVDLPINYITFFPHLSFSFEISPSSLIIFSNIHGNTVVNPLACQGLATTPGSEDKHGITQIYNTYMEIVK